MQEKKIPTPYHIQLTLYIELHCVAFAVALLVAADARIRTTAGARHVLQHQALIRHDYASCRIVVQEASLQTNTRKIRKVNETLRARGGASFLSRAAAGCGAYSLFAAGLRARNA